ncbi:MAG: hypothetical protein V3V31_13680 [Methylococcales bacterium]
MTTLSIKDLAIDTEIDRDAMADVRGGNAEYMSGFPGAFNFLSPQLYNKVTPIAGAAEIPTMQSNLLNQADYTNAANGKGIQFISNNKFADQYNSNSVAGLLSPFVG